MDTASIIGIDLGTCYSRVGVWRNNQVEIIPDDQGRKTIPSCVAFTDSKCLVGHDAAKQIARNPLNTVFDVKRFIGRKIDDPSKHNNTKYCPFKLIVGPNGRPIVNVRFKGEIRQFHAEQISSIMKLKKNAEAHLKRPIKEAVITVPAHFNNMQRQATLDAGEIAGLNVLRLLNEPSAAALAYACQFKKREFKGNVLIFNLGGGTFDVSLFVFEDGILDVRATAGYSQLGGEDFDNKLVEYCTIDFKNKTGYDIHTNSRAMRRLRNQCETAKRILSTSTEATIVVDDLYEDKDYYCVMTRTKFEEFCLPLFNDTIKLVKEVLQRAEVPKDEVNDVVLVGGSSRIPKVVQLISDFFNGKQPIQLTNPDETVVYGAAAQAAIMRGSPELIDMVILDILPMDIGIQDAKGVVSRIVEKNLDVPILKKVDLSTHVENRPRDSVLVYQGEGQDNSILSKFKLDGIQSAQTKLSELEMKFDVDTDCIFKVSAVDKENGKKLIVTCEEGNFSEIDKEKMKAEAEILCKEEDKKQV